MRIVTTRGGNKPNHWATMKLRRPIKLKWPAIANWYAQKSHGNKAISTLIRLLQDQVDKLRNRCLARKVFVSSRCSAAMPLEAREKKQGDDMIRNGELYNCAGTMQDLIHILRTNMKL
ncbi:hypothetical protein G6F42_022737 [Rhizopus arrhizus]|nr:hypothetical protein G6F42_022737 [Rhizopus arrhizus]